MADELNNRIFWRLRAVEFSFVGPTDCVAYENVTSCLRKRQLNIYIAVVVRSWKNVAKRFAESMIKKNCKMTRAWKVSVKEILQKKHLYLLVRLMPTIRSVSIISIDTHGITDSNECSSAPVCLCNTCIWKIENKKPC